MSVGFKHDSGYIPPSMEKAAELDLSKDVSINRDYDVPFCCGCSKDGKTVYVDKDIDLKKGGIDRTKPVIVHELVEWLLMNTMGLPYKPAHYVATSAEEAAVRADGYSLVKYNSLWDADIRMCATKKKPKVPPDLFTEPYADDGTEHEKEDVGLMGGHYHS